MSPWAWFLIGIIVLAAVAAVIWYSVQPAVAPAVTPQPTAAVNAEGLSNAAAPELPVAQDATVASPVSFQARLFTLTKTPHFVSTEPTNNAVLTTGPTQVAITFNFDVVPPSTITVLRDGVDVTGGVTIIAADKLSMSAPANAEKTGNYQVNYTACWPDQSCHNGSYGFSVQLQ